MTLRLFDFQVDGFSKKLDVIRFRGHEAISQLFSFDVIVACADNSVSFDKVIGKRAVLEFPAEGGMRAIHGIVSEVSQGEEGVDATAYHFTVVPTVWRLTNRNDNRIFQELSTPQILKKVLDGASIIDVKVKLAGSYSPREYCVQYGESDWAFVCRLMEEDGIAYWFEHAKDKDTLVLGDAVRAHDPIEGTATLPYHLPGATYSKTEHVFRFRWTERMRPGKVSLRDYNFKKPALSLDASKAGASDTDLEVYDYPGDHELPAQGTAAAGVRLEALQTAKRTGEGDSICPRLVPGSTFSLDEHPRGDLNQEYLVTSVEHEGAESWFSRAQDSTRDLTPYRNTFEVMPASVPFRPPPATPRPRIRGVQTAIVVGPGGEEIYTDEHGRIKVQFHWDRQGKNDEHSSCWIRVAQMWAGGSWGALYIPRIGHEVVVDFLEGDPDRPLVIGSVYHATNVPPYSLPAEKSKSTIKSNSTIGGGGFNEFRFEDKKGSEEIFLHGQKDWNIKIKHDKNQLVGNDETLEVDHDRTKLVKNDQSETVGGNKTIHVKKSHDETIDKDESLSVGGSRSVDVSKDHSESVGGGQQVDIGKDQGVTVGGAASLSVGKNQSVSVGGNASETVSKNKTVDVTGGEYKITVSKDMTVTVSKNMKEEAGEERTILVAKKLAIKCGDASILLEKNGNITIEGKEITVKGSGPIKVQGSKLDVKSDGAVNIEASGNVKIKGSQAGIN